MANQDLQQMSNSPWPTAGKVEGAASKTEGAGSLSERTERAAQQAAGSAIEQVRSVQTGISQQRDQVANRIRRVGDLMRESGDRVRKEDEMAADYFRMASQRIDSVASYVSHADFSTMAADTQEFVRKRPAVFFGGAFLLGLVAGRFLKASSGHPGGSAGGTRSPMSYGARDFPSSSGDVKRLPSEAIAGTPARSNPASASASASPASPQAPGAAAAPNTGVRYAPGAAPSSRPGTATNTAGSSGNQGSSRLP